MIESIARHEPRAPQPGRVNILPGWHLTVADIEHIRSMVEAFGLEPAVFPDISGALDGTVPARWIPTTYGGTTIDDIRSLGDAALYHRDRRADAAPAQRIES